MIRNYYIDIEDKFERLKLEAYLMDHGFKWFDATKYDPKISDSEHQMSLTAIAADLEAYKKLLSFFMEKK